MAALTLLALLLLPSAAAQTAPLLWLQPTGLGASAAACSGPIASWPNAAPRAAAWPFIGGADAAQFTPPQRVWDTATGLCAARFSAPLRTLLQVAALDLGAANQSYTISFVARVPYNNPTGVCCCVVVGRWRQQPRPCWPTLAPAPGTCERLTHPTLSPPGAVMSGLQLADRGRWAVGVVDMWMDVLYDDRSGWVLPLNGASQTYPERSWFIYTLQRDGFSQMATLYRTGNPVGSSLLLRGPVGLALGGAYHDSSRTVATWDWFR